MEHSLGMMVGQAGDQQGMAGKERHFLFTQYEHMFVSCDRIQQTPVCCTDRVA